MTRALDTVPVALADARCPVDETARLTALERLGIMYSEPESDYDDLARLAAETCDATAAAVLFVDGENTWIKALHGRHATSWPRHRGFSRFIVDDRTSLWVSDVAADRRLADLPQASGEQRIRAFGGVPLLSEDGQVLGALCVSDPHPREFSDRHRAALEALGRQVKAALISRTRAIELHRSEQRYRSLVETTTVGVLVLDGAIVRYANSSAADLFGEDDAEAFVGHDVGHRVYLTDDTGASGDVQTWLLQRPDETLTVAEVREGPLEWSDGRTLTQVQLHDVTSERQAQHQLVESEARYRLMAENSTDMIVLHDEDGSCRFVSPGSLSVLGYRPEQLIGRDQLEFVHPDDSVALIDHHIQARRLCVDRFTHEMRMKHHDGDWVWVESTVRFNYDDTGCVNGFQTQTRDITERILIEQEREQATRRFRAAMDSAPIGMAIMTIDTRLTEVNPAMCAMVGYDADQLIGRNLADLVHPDSLPGARQEFRSLLSGDSSAIGSELRYIRGDGTLIWVHRTAALVRDNAGRPAYAVLQLTDVTARKNAEEELARQALSDPLTGLPNRTRLRRRLTDALPSAIEHRMSVGLVFIDLDRFKNINDSLGHEAGDAILLEVATRLSHSVRGEDMAVRLGGDEFVVLCENLTGLSDLQIVARRIEEALSAPYLVGSREIHMTASIGLSLADSDDPDSLLRHSDAAMYLAKGRGRGRTEVYDASLESGVVDQLALEEDLHRALARDELRLYYQPIVATGEDQIVRYEALIRWQHPDRGLLAPGQFLPSVEDSPLIGEIGAWVLRRACTDIAAFDGITGVSVNVSPQQLTQPGFAGFVARVLADSGLEPERLTLEITETSILRATAVVLANTSAITDSGVTLALDDFGTGQSSLSSLQRLPISVLKIDRSFTSQIGVSASTERLITGILQLAWFTGLDVVAEGVEEQEQADFLAFHGCPHIQGYLYGKPAPLPQDDATA